MAFFRKSELSPVERLEGALEDKQAARQKLADRLSAAEAALVDKRGAAEQAAMVGAADAELDRAEAATRAVEDRVATLRAALAQLDDQTAEVERELAEAKTQRDRELVAGALEAMAAAVAQAAPQYDAAAVGLIEAVTSSSASISEATSFATHLDAMRRDIGSAAALICAELRSSAARARSGQARIGFRAPPGPEPSPPPKIEREVVYTLDWVRWQEDGATRTAPPYAQVDLPKERLPAALRHQQADLLGSERTRRFMELHGSGQSYVAPRADDQRLVDLDDLAAEESAEVAS